MKKQFLILMLAIQASCSYNHKKDVAEDPNNVALAEETALSEGETYAHPVMFEDGDICISEDRRVKIESGICPESGTATSYWAIWTFTNEKNEQHEISVLDSPFISHVHSLQKKDGSTYYMVRCFAKASSSDGYQWVEAYTIEDGELRQVDVIDGKETEKSRTFEINYCIPDWYFTTYGEGYDWLHEYDPTSRKLYIPIGVDRGITDRYHVWQFDGDKFVPLGEHPHKGLHPSMSQYIELVRYVTTRDYIGRVDRLTGNRLRYASWKKPKSISDKPDLIIVKPEDPDDYDNLAFRNGPYEYQICYTETYDDENGIDKFKDFLVVRKNGKIILKQKII